MWLTLLQYLLHCSSLELNPPVVSLNYTWLNFMPVYFSSVALVSNSLWPHEPQHTRPPCPSPTPRVHPNPCPLSLWCYPTICHPILLLPSIFPTIRVFSNESALCIRWPKYWSFGFNISPSNEHPGLISFRMDHPKGFPYCPRDSQEFSPIPQFKSINSSVLSFLYSPTLTSIHDHWKTTALTRQTFVGKVMSLLFNMLSRLVITFLPLP